MTRRCWTVAPWSRAEGSLSRLFDDFTRTASAGVAPQNPQTAPALSGWEEEGAYVLELELPGLTDNDVELELLEDTLEIRGEWPASIPEGARPIRGERRTGPFTRRIGLHGEIDATAVEAGLEHGVLRIVLPKLPETRPRRIEIGRGPAVSLDADEYPST